jgi:hypothetical protein
LNGFTWSLLIGRQFGAMVIERHRNGKRPVRLSLRVMLILRAYTLPLPLALGAETTTHKWPAGGSGWFRQYWRCGSHFGGVARRRKVRGGSLV